MTGVAAIVVAAGAGARFGQAKQFAYLRGKPVLEWSLEVFQAHPRIDAVVLVLPGETVTRHYKSRYPKVVETVPGGERRQDSVWQGFRMLDPARAGIVLVHDGARPLVSPDLIDRVIAAAESSGAAVPVLPVEETLKTVDAGGRVTGTVDRETLARAQTPQGFRYDLLDKALRTARAERFYGTDEAMLVERTGAPVAAIPGDTRNVKITTPVDLVFAECLLND